MEDRLDKLGIAIFLVFTLGLTYAVAGALFALELMPLTLGGLRPSLILVSQMFIPALGALLASLVRGDPAYPKLRIWPLPVRPVVTVSLLIPAIFAGSYFLAWLCGRVQPDWQLQLLMGSLANTQTATLPPLFYLVAGFVLMIILGPTLYALPCVGVEIGWRAYLLPKLLPLGRVRAHLVMGLLMALWILPLAYAMYGAAAEAHLIVLWTVGMALAFGTFLGETWLRARHAGLTAVCAGCFLSQMGGMWSLLFPQQALPGNAVTVGIAVALWLAAAVVAGLVPPGTVDRVDGDETGSDAVAG